jgi:hypothetical protein
VYKVGAQYLSEQEEAALAALEDEQGRGDGVSWDAPKTVKGVMVRDVETITFTDKNDGVEKQKRVATLRTADGLVAIFEGPAKLNSRLFDGEQFQGESIGAPTKGQLVIVTYKGERLSQNGRDYKDFDVVRGPVPKAMPAPEAKSETTPSAQNASGEDGIPW